MACTQTRRLIGPGVVLLAGLLMGCQDGVLPPVTAPTPVTTKAFPKRGPLVLPPGYSEPLWDLTTILTAVTGPDNCFAQPRRAQIGTSTAWVMAVARSETTVRLLYDVWNYPTDHIEYVGTTNQTAFTAKQIGWSDMSFPTCADGTTLSGTFDSSVTGSFAGDGTHLTAKEVWEYHFTSGDVTLSMDWTASVR